MISVSLEYDCDALLDGLRAPPLTGVFSPAASANGATQMASTTALAASQTPLPLKRDMVPPCRWGTSRKQDEAPWVAVRADLWSAPCPPPRPRAPSSARSSRRA